MSRGQKSYSNQRVEEWEGGERERQTGEERERGKKKEKERRHAREVQTFSFLSHGMPLCRESIIYNPSLTQR